MMHVGFTGTREGMTVQQRLAVAELAARFSHLVGLTVHHGDCIGADAEFHSIMRGIGAFIVGHLPVDVQHRAFCDFHDVRPPLTYLMRNRQIVAAATVMIATPREATVQPRGGTWYTIGYTRKCGKPLAVVIPDGAIEFSGAPWPV